MSNYVYQLVDPRSMKPFYIGEGTGNRAWSHEKFKSGCNNPHKDRIIQKIHNMGMSVQVVIIKDGLTKSESIKLEALLIEQIGIENLSNISKDANPPVLCGTANGFYGKTHTDETKQKLGDINRGKDIKTETGKLAISKSMKERWANPMLRERQIDALKQRRGEKRSDAAIESYKAAAAIRDANMTPEQRSARTLAGCETKKIKYAGMKRARYFDESGKMRFKYIDATPQIIGE